MVSEPSEIPHGCRGCTSALRIGETLVPECACRSHHGCGRRRRRWHANKGYVKPLSVSGNSMRLIGQRILLELLEKPFTKDALVRKVRGALDSSKTKTQALAV